MEKKIQIRKAVSEFRKDANIKECFHFDNDSCSKKIISAHSIQRNGILSLIEDEVGGNLKVYSFLHKAHNSQGDVIGLGAIGKKEASTFNGFCGFHDTELFKEIENNPVNIADDYHCFLLSYRAFAKEYHAKKECLKGVEINEFYARPEMAFVKERAIYEMRLGLRDFNSVKQRLNDILKRKKYDEMVYFSYTLDYLIPITLASSINPEYSYSNKVLNKTINENVFYEFLNFIIFPTPSGQTHVLFSCLPEHKKSIDFIEELEQLNDYKLERAISSLVIAYVENTFISPSIWKKLGSKGQKRLLEELRLTLPNFRQLITGFFHSKINLLSPKFKTTPPNKS